MMMMLHRHQLTYLSISTAQQRVRTQREAEQRRRRASKKTRPDPRDICVDDF